MYNEGAEQYSENDLAGVNGESNEEGEEDLDEYEDYIKINRDHVFAEIDYTKRKTNIICSLGPCSSETEDIVKLMDAGMCIARINIAHMNEKSIARLMKQYREARRLRPHKTCGLMLDLRGREIRMNNTEENIPIKLRGGQTLIITGDNPMQPSNNEIIQCSIRDIARLLQLDDIIYIDDGNVIGTVIDLSPENGSATIEVKGNAELHGHKLIRLSGDKHQKLPIITKRDETDLISLALNFNFDYISIGYTTKAADIQYIKDVLGPKGAHINVLAKIDNLESLHRFEELLRVADGIIIDRVELGLELPPEKMFLAQRWIINRTNNEGKPIFIQSQILESLANGQQATRAESEDIANAVMEGCDGFILTKETAVLKNYVAAVQELAKVSK